MPDCAIFADTRWEQKATYAHLDWLSSPNVLPFPVHRVSRGDLRQAILDRRNSQGKEFSAVPWFTINQDGSHGMGRRQCTHEYKLVPLMWKMRELLGVDRRARIPVGAVEVWIGISTDEAMRMKPASQQWQRTRWPLIEAGMSRRDCETWLTRNDYPLAPKSACNGCPFHNNAMWRNQRDNSPEEWADTIMVDHAMRLDGSQEFMHVQRVPLAQVDLSTHAERGQADLFGNECEGMCGV